MNNQVITDTSVTSSATGRTTEPLSQLVDIKDIFSMAVPPEIVAELMEDLFSPAEVEAFTERWKIAQLLDQGLPYREIGSELGVSTATVTRVARCLKRESSGYQLMLDYIKATDQAKLM